MEFALLTFVLVTAIVAGVYWLFAERTEAQEASHLRGRLRRSVQGGALTKRLMNDPVRLSDVRALNQVLRRSGQMIAPLQRLIEQSGLKMTVGALVLSCMVTAAVAFAVVSQYLHLPLLAFPVAAAAAYLPIMYGTATGRPRTTGNWQPEITTSVSG